MRLFPQNKRLIGKFSLVVRLYVTTVPQKSGRKDKKKTQKTYILEKGDVSRCLIVFLIEGKRLRVILIICFLSLCLKKKKTI